MTFCYKTPTLEILVCFATHSRALTHMQLLGSHNVSLKLKDLKSVCVSL